MLRQIYGMTEAGGVATATLKSEALDHPESCGSGSIFTEVRVMRPDGTFAASGEQGELVVRGPGVTPGYWKDTETTAAAIRDGWLHSGDLGVCDDAGSDHVRRPAQGPDHLRRHQYLPRRTRGGDCRHSTGVAEVAVIPAPDPRFGETPAAIVRGRARPRRTRRSSGGRALRTGARRLQGAAIRRAALGTAATAAQRKDRQAGGPRGISRCRRPVSPGRGDN